MKVAYASIPFPHVIIREFYTPEEYNSVWAEVVSLQRRAGAAETTGPATNEQGVSLKQNSGVFLSGLYKEEYFSSPVVAANRKLFSLELMQQLCGFDFLFQYLPATNYDDTLVQFYKNGDYYKTHKDTALFSATVLLHRSPKRYTGGELRFTYFDYQVDIQDNDCVLFPSFVPHEVTEIKSAVDDVLDNRVSITTFVNIR